MEKTVIRIYDSEYEQILAIIRGYKKSITDEQDNILFHDRFWIMHTHRLDELRKEFIRICDLELWILKHKLAEVLEKEYYRIFYPEKKCL